MRASAGEALLQLETLKLLLQLAWADLHVHENEAQLVLERAIAAGLPAEMLGKIESYLRGERVLPAPDLQMLKSRKGDVLRACRALVAADERLTIEEQEVLSLVDRALDS